MVPEDGRAEDEETNNDDTGEEERNGSTLWFRLWREVVRDVIVQTVVVTDVVVNSIVRAFIEVNLQVAELLDERFVNARISNMKDNFVVAIDSLRHQVLKVSEDLVALDGGHVVSVHRVDHLVLLLESDVHRGRMVDHVFVAFELSHDLSVQVRELVGVEDLKVHGPLIIVLVVTANLVRARLGHAHDDLVEDASADGEAAHVRDGAAELGRGLDVKRVRSPVHVWNVIKQSKNLDSLILQLNLVDNVRLLAGVNLHELGRLDLGDLHGSQEGIHAGERKAALATVENDTVISARNISKERLVGKVLQSTKSVEGGLQVGSAGGLALEVVSVQAELILFKIKRLQFDGLASLNKSTDSVQVDLC